MKVKKHPKYLRVINALICMCILISHLQDLVIVANASIIDSSNSTLTEISDGGLNESTQESEDSFNTVENNESNSTFIEEESNEEELPSQEAIDIDDVSINDEIDLEIEQEETESIAAQSIDLVSEHTEGRSVGSGLVQFKVEGTTTCGYNHNLYPNRGKSEHATYINSCYVDDALYLGEDADYYYIYISGYEGKVLKEERQGNVRIIAEYIPANPVRTASLGLEEAEVLDVPYLNYADQTLNEKEKAISLVSMGTVQSPSYYANESGTLVHYITKNVTIDRNYSKIIVGLAPEWMQQGYKYYSYDGIYFYNRTACLCNQQ